MDKTILPGSTIGIIGGGQLGQMMSFCAKEMGYKVIILDPQENCSAAQVSDDQIVAEYSDVDQLVELAKRCDVLTYEFENVDAAAINEVKKYTQVPQGTKALKVTQNRISEKDFIDANGFSTVPHVVIENIFEYHRGVEKLGAPVILKTIRGGYDGKGQILITDPEDVCFADIEHLLMQGPCMLEKKIDLEKEVSVVVSANSKGEKSIFPIIENVHRHNILHLSTCPAQISEKSARHIYNVAETLAEKLELVGTMCIEFFISDKDEVFVNEIAPRPHNSGHLTIEACNISQFDAHIRGVCNLAMPKVELLKPAAMVNLLGQHLEPAKRELAQHPEWHFHDYGKDAVKENRKMGHITILSDDLEKTKQAIENNSIWDV
ncbi:5-(carboxyamino)imidazole ribonucleotide synthase [Companilactobacillus pabuli]|uniref:N5-carboxyaminoimidazole ribonucleotide synthase n=1 Tax=Companilactobacillus pabuli TaxID=2714036 RepID=A0A7L7KWW6_9LACO|nr:5-(carboxyamino)imidazole ribonucleotide synthase [Companilactobacillus pabuli]AKP03718.1 phosphoribosylaminoimidazole carboxylase [Companilactobacillus farciminis]AKS52023.1 phosphoribosylaminoimidazole carboxylase [Companilactobacillus farciminis]MDG5112931.1 5-(carboxyamino)imidazole ribonucleotide synthase [Companilactobacillus pabuli]QMT84297.1 5-(carboxyamino)imidazole ribonucleotide synthase [Companilactobacillus pabuli]GAQ00586.1 phosphoribosylaminoimidazole carboxylase [Companilact